MTKPSVFRFLTETTMLKLQILVHGCILMPCKLSHLPSFQNFMAMLCILSHENKKGLQSSYIRTQIWNRSNQNQFRSTAVHQPYSVKDSQPLYVLLICNGQVPAVGDVISQKLSVFLRIYYWRRNLGRMVFLIRKLNV